MTVPRKRKKGEGMRIVFMGTPDYALRTLRALVESGQEVVGVFCQPDKPVGRKQILTAPPVKQYALEQNLPVFQPRRLKDESVLAELKTLRPDVIVVVAYGKILPKAVLDLPKYGCINGHGSLLPAYRGAAPIQWAVINGEKQTGVTTMQMDAGVDTGDILLQQATDIGATETAEQVFERLADMTAELMLKTLRQLPEGTLRPQKQDESRATYAPLIQKEMGKLDFSQPAEKLYHLVLGMYSWPCTYFYLDGKRVKVYRAEPGPDCSQPAGTVLPSDRLTVACGNGQALVLCEIQPEGGKRMDSAEYLKGHPIREGSRVEEG